MNVSLPIDYEVVFLFHFMVNVGIAAIAACRIGRMQDVLLRVRLQYVFLFVSSIAYAFAPLFFRQWPPMVSVFSSASVLYVLWSDSYQWRHGPPKEAKTQPADLYEELPDAD